MGANQSYVTRRNLNSCGMRDHRLSRGFLAELES
jgi:hypothetical protein